jgi:uncharacterized protein YecE (DUF72 family)
MPSAVKHKKPRLTLEEWRERRRLRREKQREDNVHRAAKMHQARLAMEAEGLSQPPASAPSLNVGCSGWFYWKWRGLFYPADMSTREWFDHYAAEFDTVEINASFYSWPTIANVKAWTRQPRGRPFTFTVKVCELITHIKKFKGTKTLVKDFGVVADILGERMGCFLFQLPPSFHYSKPRLKSILNQLDPARRNVVEFRHKSWWNETVYKAFREAGVIFCSCSAPRLPEELIKTADDVYLRLHGSKRWYRHNYSTDELRIWAEKIKASGAKSVWVYFDNDNDAYAIANAKTMHHLLAPRRTRSPGKKKAARGATECTRESL